MHRFLFALLSAAALSFFSMPVSLATTEVNPHAARAERIMSQGFGIDNPQTIEDHFLVESGALLNGYPVIIGLARDYIESARADGVDTRLLESNYRQWLHASLEEHAFGHILRYIDDYALCRRVFREYRSSPEAVAFFLDEGIREVHKVEDLMTVAGVSLHRIVQFRRERDEVFYQMRERLKETERTGVYCADARR